MLLLQVKRDVRLQFQRQHSPLVPILLALLSLGYALHSLTLAAKGEHGSSSSLQGSGMGVSQAAVGSLLSALGQHVVAPLLVAVGLVVLVQKNGKMLVDRPQLCPQLANTVAHAEKQQ